MACRVANEYVSKFRKLTGKNLDEYIKNFGIFFKELTLTDKKVVIAFLNKLTLQNMNTLLEWLLQIKIMAHFEHWNLLNRLLYRNNWITSRKIIRNKHYQLYMGRNIDIEAFINHFCEKLSYVNRIYFIKKIAPFVDDAEAFYKEIFLTYGFSAAKGILPYCSTEMIIACVRERHITFSDRMLIRFHRRDSAFLENYFELSNDELRKQLCVHLSSDPVLLRLNKVPKFGNRSFHNFCKFNLDYVMANSIHFARFGKRFMHMHGLANFRIFFENMFPSLEDDFILNKEIVATLQVFDKKSRGSEFFSVYKKLYNRDYVEPNEDLINILTMEDRLKLNIGNSLEYLPAAESLQKFREMENLTDKVFINMLKCCKLNNCPDTLLEVITTFTNHNLHKQKNIMFSFMKHLQMLQLEDMGEKHWHYIHSIMLYIQNVSVFELPVVLEFFVRYTLFRHKNGLPCQDMIYTIIRYSISAEDLRFFKEYPDVERHFLIVLSNIIDMVTNMDIDQLKLKYLYTIYLYNEDNKKTRLSVSDLNIWFTSYIESLHNQDLKCLFKVHYIIKEIWCQSTTDANYEVYKERVLSAYFSNLHCMISEDLLMWFLIHHPHMIEKYADVIIAKTQPFLTYFRFYYELNKLEFLGLVKKFSTLCMNISEGKDMALGRGIFQHLAYQSTYQEAASRFDPTVAKIYLTNNYKMVTECHRSVLLGGKYFLYPDSVIPYLSKYCKLQYLEYFTPAFYRAIYHCKEVEAEPALLKILNDPKSLNWNHAVILVYKICKRSIFLFHLVNRLTHERSSAVFNCIFTYGIRHLRDNGDSETLSLIKNSIGKTNVNGSVYLKQLKHVPVELFCEFIRIIWKYHYSAEIIKYITVTAIGLMPDQFNKICLDMAIEHKNVQYIYNFCAASPSNVKHFCSISVIHGIIVKLVRLTVEHRNGNLADLLLTELANISFDIQIMLMLFIKYLEHEDDFALELIGFQEMIYAKYSSVMLATARSAIAEVISILHLDPVALAEEMLQSDKVQIRAKLLILEILPLRKWKDLKMTERINKIVQTIREDKCELVVGSCNLYLSGIR